MPSSSSSSSSPSKTSLVSRQSPFLHLQKRRERESERCQGGTRGQCTTVTRLTRGAAAVKTTIRRQQANTPSSRSSRSSSVASRPSRMFSPTEKASSTIPTSPFLSTWKTSMPSTLTSRPCSAPPPPTSCLFLRRRQQRFWRA
ncbi:hypothetical protein CIPAW_15G177200 [Carya illinoinensis]|uniref:Uncharacterized protein n=1 Tax=Carya illinoinensis TaxID=32201 RepID=A0A8T1N8S1_CARIL|nr:hypothetical protein CIPAW_15G177200 [Carya illinoinensis]